MAGTTFIDKQTLVTADWLNIINDAIYNQTSNITGGTPRLLSEKLGDTINLRDKGAVGDGVTDDTVAIQALINAYPSNSTLEGSGRTYKITAPLKIPNSSRFLTIKNLTIVAVGDIEVFGSVSSTDLISFFTLESCLIDVSGHTTALKPAFVYHCFSQSTFRDVWVFGAVGKTIGFYGKSTNGGSAPYYNLWDHCYFGGFSVGIMAEDAAGVPQTSNSNTVSNSRFQPGTGNFGVYIGNNNQNWRLDNNVFESAGGVGIYLSGIGCSLNGNRFESMTTGISYSGAAYGNTESGNYFDSCVANRATPGDSIYQNSYLVGQTATSGVISSLHGNTFHRSVGDQNTVSAFAKDLGTDRSTYTSDSNNTAGTTWRHFTGYSSTGSVANYAVYGNGNVVNTNNSYGAISDITLKKSILPAGPQLEKLLSIPIKTFIMKADPTNLKQIGVIAQELEEIYPNLVETDGSGIKSVKYSVFVPILLKAIQELAALIPQNK